MRPTAPRSWTIRPSFRKAASQPVETTSASVTARVPRKKWPAVESYHVIERTGRTAPMGDDSR